MKKYHRGLLLVAFIVLFISNVARVFTTFLGFDTEFDVDCLADFCFDRVTDTDVDVVVVVVVE